MGEVVRGAGMAYYHVASGKLRRHTSEKGPDGKTVYVDIDGYEGQLKKIERFKDSFEGRENEKIRVQMFDSDTGITADITFSAETFFVPGFFSRLLNVDLDKPFVIGVLPSDKNEKMSFCYMKQDGKKIEKNSDFPKPKEVPVGKTVQYDFTDVNKAVDEIIAQVTDYLKTVALAQEATPEE